MINKHSFLLFFLLVLVLTSCLPNAENDAPLPVELAPATSQPVVLVNESAPDEDATTITIALGEYERSVYEPLIERFLVEHPEIQVQIVAQRNTTPEDLDYDRAQATQADISIFSLDSSYPGRRGSENIWHDLKPFLDADASFDRTDFYTGTLESVSDATHIYGLPLTWQVNLLAYNKDIWEANNLPTPSPDWTWKDLNAAAEQIGQSSSRNTVYGFLEAHNYYESLLAAFEDQGIDPYTTSYTNFRLDDPRYIAMMEQLARSTQARGIYMPPNPGGPLYFKDIQAKITNQQVAVFSAVWLHPESPLRIGYAPNVIRGPWYSRARSLVMSGGTKHPEAAWQLMAYLSANQPPGSLPHAKGIIPARKSVANRAGFWEKLAPDEKAAIEVMLNRSKTVPYRRDSLYRTLRYAGDAIRSMVQDGQTAQQAATAAQAAFEQAQAEPTTPTLVPLPLVVNTPIPAAPQTATTISFSAVGADRSALQGRIQAFQSTHPDITMNITSRQANANSLFASLARGSDCFIAPLVPTTSTERANLLDVQPLIDADATFPRADYPAGVLARLKYNGELLGLPYQIGIPALHYDAAFLDQMGIAAPTNWSLDQFRDAAQQATTGSGIEQTYGFASDDTAYALNVWLQQSGVLPTVEQNGSLVAQFTTPEVRAAVQSYLDLLRTSSPHTRLTGYTYDAQPDESAGPLATNKVAFWFDGQDRYRETLGITTTGTIAPLPQSEQALGSFVTASTFYISAQTQHPETCWQWLRFLSDDETIEDGTYPARISQASALPSNAQAVYQAAAPTLARTTGPNTDVFDDSRIDLFWFYRAVDRALQGGDLENELAEAQTTTTAYLACTAEGTAGPACAAQVDPDYGGWQQG